MLNLRKFLIYLWFIIHDDLSLHKTLTDMKTSDDFNLLRVGVKGL